ncbi:MAG: winged helix-turn-helix domain-containing protein [Bradyrhizobium sp.]|nr:winged helix-turn-helix domain-containing protein [Bradyrhizobium sp.]
MDDFVTSPPGNLPRQIVVGEFLLDRDTIRVWRKHKPLQLSMRQFRFLEIFMQQPDKPFSLRDLRLAVWGPSSAVEDATVASEIARLRHAIGYRYGKNPIKTLRSIGFMFESEPSKNKARRSRRPSERHVLGADALGSNGQA